MSYGQPGELENRLIAREAEQAIARARHQKQRALAVIVGVAVLGIIAVTVLFLRGQNIAATQVLGIVTPTVAAMLAYHKGVDNGAAIHKVELNIDGRLSQLLDRTDAAARAEGRAAGTAAREVRETDKQGDQTNAGPAN